MHLGEGLQSSKSCILSPSSCSKWVKHAIDILCLGDFHIKKAPFRISAPCQIGLLVKFSCATQNCQSKKLHGKCPWCWAQCTCSALLAHCLAVTISMQSLFSWRDVLNWPRNSSAAGRNLAGGRRASQPGSKFSVCFNLEEELPWPSGAAEDPRLKSRDHTLPVKYLRFYPCPKVGSRWGPQQELPLTRELSLSVSRAPQLCLQACLSWDTLDGSEDILHCFSFPHCLWWSSKKPFYFGAWSWR